MSAVRTLVRFVAIVLIIGVVLIGFVACNLRNVAKSPPQPATAVSAANLLLLPIAANTPNAALVTRGQYLVRVGDCLSCHLRAGGSPFAGGLGLNTPFGIIYSSNITSDKTNGIGDWTPDQFYHAMHDGIGAHNEHLYPAFPYPWFTRVSRADDDAILAYLKTTAPVSDAPPHNELPFPFSVREVMAGWNLLFLKSSSAEADSAQSKDWNRGAEIVNGLGHCSACHTPKNMFGADKSSQQFYGGVLEDFVAPDLTSNEKTGLGSWTVEDIADYLKKGRNQRANAGGPMADVITYSTSLMTDDDRRGIAVYLKGQPASAVVAVSPPDAAAVKRGAEIYSDACSACHLKDGAGQPQFFPPLGHNAVVQQQNPLSLLHIVLAGSRTGPSPTRPSPLTMPSFAWKLSDQEVADVTTYLRNSWGNQASGVSVDNARAARKELGLTTDHLTENSGDR